MKHGAARLIWLKDSAPLTGIYLAPQWINGVRIATVSVNGERFNFEAAIVTDCGDLSEALDRGSLPSSEVGRA